VTRAIHLVLFLLAALAARGNIPRADLPNGPALGAFSRADSIGTVLHQYDTNNNLANIFEGGKTNSWAFDAYDRVSSYREGCRAGDWGNRSPKGA
jgi:hypothetical protein